MTGVPAGPWAFGHLDRQLGHFRRYSKRRIRHLAGAGGLDAEGAFVDRLESHVLEHGHPRRQRQRCAEGDEAQRDAPLGVERDAAGGQKLRALLRGLARAAQQGADARLEL